MIHLFTLWTYGAAALAYALIAAWQFRGWADGGARRAFAIAATATSAWALSVAAFDLYAVPALIGASLRNLSWLAFMLILLGGDAGDDRKRAVQGLFAVLAAVVLTRAGLAPMLAEYAGSPRIIAAIEQARLVLGITFSAGALILVHYLYTAALPEARWGIRLAMLGLGGMWAYDLNLDAASWFGSGWSHALLMSRGAAMLALAPVFVLAALRNRRWKLGLSRTVTFRSLSAIAIAGYLATMGVVTRLLEAIGGEYVRVAEILFVFGATLAAMLLLPSGRGRAWLKVKVAKHLFQHRYDYREEWLRFTATLGGLVDHDEPLPVRAVRAIADITESPGGLLLRVDEDERLAPSARWRWEGAAETHADRGFAHYLEASERILELDLLRSGDTDLLEEAALLPAWLLENPRAWAAVPLIHGERLEGVVVVARPAIDRMLDWEDFDLLRVAGRQVASHLAEARSQEALSAARRFDEFNRRFAFIIHDVKNLVSQLSLVARNAERHADNPAFRADMVATLKSSVDKLNELLARLSQHNTAKAEEPRPLPLRDLVEQVARARSVGHDVRVAGRSDVVALADPARLAQALGHLVQNAAEASPDDEPVWISIDRVGLDAVVAVLDRGCGMSADFVRGQLFKPFASTKQGGFGIGAYEARGLVAAMGGRLEVESREGEGSRFAIILPIGAEEPMRRRA
ncbi:MAG: PEP-CTERM system histidine kinase PrsK [Sphingomonadaceae bacterium]|nr:PEP-CTERM system histidine kinase PrsK [Sphingomonadaceae bacterium]